MKKKAKRKSAKKSPRKVNPTDLVRAGLGKLKKSDLVELLTSYASNDIEIRRDLEDKLAIEKPVELIISDIDSAIATATDFDDRDINRNFSFDYAAYEAVEKGLKQLIQQGELAEAQRLSLELMKQGSYQVECSDEGMMTEEIEDCLKPVIHAVKKEGGDEAIAWAKLMIAADRVGFICEQPLRQLASTR